MLPVSRYHPFHLDSYGFGQLIKKVAGVGTRRLIVGIGGTATNDGGFGMARALGWRFFGRRNNEIVEWTKLRGLRSLEPPPCRLGFSEVLVAVDVQNPLLGPRGASCI